MPPGFFYLFAQFTERCGKFFKHRGLPTVYSVIKRSLSIQKARVRFHALGERWRCRDGGLRYTVAHALAGGATVGWAGMWTHAPSAP